MVQIAGYYDENAEPSGDFSPIPAGQYVAEIVESAIEPVSKSSDKGNCLKLTWKISDGELAGRLVWQRLNMWFEGAEKKQGEVARIANQQFASIRQACGKGVIENTDELHFIPALITVKIKVDPNGQYAPQNEIAGVKPFAPAGNAFAGAMNAGATSAPPARPASPPGGGTGGAPRAASAAGTFSFRR
jgi:hypothetical protein